MQSGVDNIRRLLSSLCGASGTARLFDAEGAPLSCGNLGIVVDRLGVAEVTAAVTRKDALDAFGALTRDGLYFGHMSDKQRSACEKLADKLAPRVEPVSGPDIGARPASSSAPSFSPLAFEANGALLIRSQSSVVRVLPNGEEQALDAEAGVAPWPLAIVLANGNTLANVVYACDRSEALLSYQKPDKSFAAPVVLGLLSPRPGACAGGKLPKLPPLSPLSEKPAGLEAIVAGKIVGPKTSPAEAALRPQPHGTARSPDGRWLALAAPGGVLLHSTDKDELWTIPGVLEHCVAANDGKAVACVVGGRARVWRRP